MAFHMLELSDRPSHHIHAPLDRKSEMRSLRVLDVVSLRVDGEGVFGQVWECTAWASVEAESDLGDESSMPGTEEFWAVLGGQEVSVGGEGVDILICSALLS